MQDVFKYIFLISEVLGFVMVCIALIGFNKLGKEHKKVSNDDLLLENEKLIQSKNIRIFIIGFLIIAISTLISGIELIF